MSRPSSELSVIGWREWIAVPSLGLAHVKVKIDTGARTSALHAIDIERFQMRGRAMVRFNVHPIQRDSRTVVACQAEIIDERMVRSSSGHRGRRPVIRPEVELFGARWPIELTLVGRDAMGFRMLLGREAVRGRFLVHPGASYKAGVPDAVRKRKRKSR